MRRIARLTAAVAGVAMLSAGTLSTATATATAAQPDAQNCIFRILQATYITFEGETPVLLEPNEEIAGPNELGSIWAFSYKHVRSGWIYRNYDNMRVVGCDP